MSNKVEATFHPARFHSITCDPGCHARSCDACDCWCREKLCHAENLEEGRPASNPPHVCILPEGHFPGTDHEDYSGNKWRKPGQPHQMVVP